MAPSEANHDLPTQVFGKHHSHLDQQTIGSVDEQLTGVGLGRGVLDWNNIVGGEQLRAVRQEHRAALVGLGGEIGAGGEHERGVGGVLLCQHQQRGSLEQHRPGQELGAVRRNRQNRRGGRDGAAGKDGGRSHIEDENRAGAGLLVDADDLAAVGRGLKLALAGEIHEAVGRRQLGRGRRRRRYHNGLQSAGSGRRGVVGRQHRLSRSRTDGADEDQLAIADRNAFRVGTQAHRGLGERGRSEVEDIQCRGGIAGHVERLARPRHGNSQRRRVRVDGGDQRRRIAGGAINIHLIGVGVDYVNALAGLVQNQVRQRLRMSNHRPEGCAPRGQDAQHTHQ